MNETEVVTMSTSSEIGYIPISESSDAVISVDNLPDYSGGFFGITFAIGIMAGLFFARLSSWKM